MSGTLGTVHAALAGRQTSAAWHGTGLAVKWDACRRLGSASEPHPQMHLLLPANTLPKPLSHQAVTCIFL